MGTPDVRGELVIARRHLTELARSIGIIGVLVRMMFQAAFQKLFAKLGLRFRLATTGGEARKLVVASFDIFRVIRWIDIQLESPRRIKSFLVSRDKRCSSQVVVFAFVDEASRVR